MGRTLIAIGLLLLVVGVIVEFGGHFLPWPISPATSTSPADMAVFIFPS